MDLLEQYKQQNPEAFREKKSAPMADAYGREYTGMIALAMRVSGGRIRDARTVSKIVVFCAGAIFLIAVVWWVWGSGGGIDTKKNFVPAISQNERQ